MFFRSEDGVISLKFGPQYASYTQIAPPQACKHPIHDLISSSCPLKYLFGVSGSQINCRPICIISAFPCCINSSAILGSTILPTPITGTFTFFLIASAIWINPPRST